MLPLSMLRGGQSVVWCWSLYQQHLCVMIHPSGEWCTVINVKIEEICSACLCAVGRSAEMLSLLLSVFRAKWDASGSLGQKCLSL